MAGKFESYAANSAPADADLLASVDISDTSMSANGTTKSLTLTALKTYVKTGPAFANSLPANPAASGSASLLMMGVGGTCKITPGSSGKVLVTVTGTVLVNTAANILATWGGRFGTGTAPVNGAAVTGTRFGGAADYNTQTATAAVKVPWALTDLLTLTPGTAYWFDLALATATPADTAQLVSISFTALEIS